VRTIEIKDKDKNLMIVDEYNKNDFDVNVFEKGSDVSFFTELNVNKKRLKEIIKFLEF